MSSKSKVIEYASQMTKSVPFCPNCHTRPSEYREFVSTLVDEKTDEIVHKSLMLSWQCSNCQRHVELKAEDIA